MARSARDGGERVMTRGGAWLIVALIAALAVVLAIPGRESRPPEPIAPAAPIRRFVDETGRIAPANVDAEAAFLDGVMIESGIDLRVRIVRSTHGVPLPAYALATMREQQIGRDVGGRGMLIVLDDSTKEARIEVGPHLEGIFPDGFVTYLLRDNLSPMFATGSTELAIRTTLFMIHYRTREARLGGDYDPRALRYVKEVRRLASGGGGSVPLPPAVREDGPLMFPPGEVGVYFSPQPTVEAAYQRQLEYFALGMWPQPVRLITASSYDFLAGQPRARGWNEYLLTYEYGYSYAIDERDDLAMLYFTGTPFRSPLFFRRTDGRWQIDVAAEIRNSNEVVATYLTWRLVKSGDEYSTRFADRYEPVSNTGFDEFFRVRGGDNRTMCIYGEPGKPMGERLHDSLCLGGSLPLAGVP
jgi:hypothetical protein